MEDREEEFYHGSFCKFDAVDLSKSKPYRDFGSGFYITNIFEQAAIWACKWRKRAWISEKEKFIHSKELLPAYVYKYNLDFSSANLNIIKYETYNENWLDFVVKCRSGKETGDYDIVIGPMADADVYAVVREFEEKEISANEALEKLKFKKTTHQLLIHTEKALKYLKKTDVCIL